MHKETSNFKISLSLLKKCRSQWGLKSTHSQAHNREHRTCNRTCSPTIPQTRFSRHEANTAAGGAAYGPGNLNTPVHERSSRHHRLDARPPPSCSFTVHRSRRYADSQGSLRQGNTRFMSDEPRGVEDESHSVLADNMGPNHATHHQRTRACPSTKAPLSNLVVSDCSFRVHSSQCSSPVSNKGGSF
ncbi:hypothetical protein BDR06DRAFT_113079 [Suillus hirtellus]|nr:hypothetical protein BDR06DRAFT_113079 [Suillus hirtellus]